MSTYGSLQAREEEVLMVFEKATRNCYRYSEDPDRGPLRVGKLYIQKWLLGKHPPKRISIMLRKS